MDRRRGFGPPIQDMIGNSFLWRMIDRTASFLARVWPSMFSYQFVVEATRLDDTDELLAQTVDPAAQPTAEKSGAAAEQGTH